jgi:hypothetical protein
VLPFGARHRGALDVTDTNGAQSPVKPKRSRWKRAAWILLLVVIVYGAVAYLVLPLFWVESECGAVALGRTYLLPPLSFGGALLVRPWLRFHIPLIEPDMQISRIRLSDKTSRLHPRHVVPKPA